MRRSGIMARLHYLQRVMHDINPVVQRKPGCNSGSCSSIIFPIDSIMLELRECRHAPVSRGAAKLITLCLSALQGHLREPAECAPLRPVSWTRLSPAAVSVAIRAAGQERSCDGVYGGCRYSFGSSAAWSGSFGRSERCTRPAHVT